MKKAIKSFSCKLQLLFFAVSSLFSIFIGDELPYYVYDFMSYNNWNFLFHFYSLTCQVESLARKLKWFGEWMGRY